MNPACSTCWNSSRHQDGEMMMLDIQELGFDAVELSHGIRISLMEGIERYLKRADAMRITSLHNFCPVPIEVTRPSPNCYEFSSHRRTERDRAVRLTKTTIRFASRLGAQTVVLHLGSVPMSPITRPLAAFSAKGQFLSRRFIKRKLAAVRKREALSKFYLDRVIEALEEIVEFAAENNVQLGIETREAYEEIPTEQEFSLILDRFPSSTVGYWHDIGHAQTRHNLSFSNHHGWLASVAHRLVGCHIHDVRWPTNDHHVPWKGDINYDTLMPLISPAALMVFELNPRCKRADIRAARERWTRESQRWATEHQALQEQPVTGPAPTADTNKPQLDK